MSCDSRRSPSNPPSGAKGETFVIDDQADEKGEAEAQLADKEVEEIVNCVVAPEVTESTSNVTFDLSSSCNSELPPFTPGSSLSKSLKFLEASHLLSDEEMIKMGCQPPSRNVTCSLHPESATGSLPFDLSNASSLLTESLLNASINNEGNRPITSTCVKSQVSSQPRIGNDDAEVRPDGKRLKEGDLFDDIHASPISFDADQVEDSEIDNLTFSLKSHDLESVPDKSLEVSLNESELCSESVQPESNADMEVLDKLSERSLSEADLTMRDDEVEESGSEAHAVSLGGGAKKKRTRSPTPSSVKTESVPAKRSLTLQRNRPTPSSGRPLSTTGPRRSAVQSSVGRQSGVTASSNSLSDKGPRRSGPGALKKTSPGASSASLSRTAAGGGGGDGGTRRSLTSAKGAPSTSQSASAASSRTPRRSGAGSISDVSAGDFKKPQARGSAAASRLSSAPSRSATRDKAATLGSLSARSATDGKGSAAASAAPSTSTTSGASSSRLKAPSLLQRTFSRKSTSSAAATASAAPPSRGGTTPRSGQQNPSTSAANLSSTAATRRKDSQLQPRSTGAKSAGRTSGAASAASSTDRHPEGSTASSSGRQPLDGRPKTASTFANVKGSGRQPLSSNSSDVKSSSRCSSPEADLREQLSSQTAQIAVQEARLSDLAIQCAEKDKAVTEVQSRLQHAVHSFSVMSLVCQTLNQRVEEAYRQRLNLEKELQEVMVRMAEVSSQCGLLAQEKEDLKQEMVKETEIFRQKFSEMMASHRTMLQNERTKLLTEKDVAVTRAIDQHSAEVKTLNQFHNKELDRVRLSFESLIEELKAKHVSNLEEISMRDEKHLEELQTQHEKKITDITRRFEDMKVTLSNRIQALHVECNELRSKSYQENEHVRRNSDYKLQAAIQQFQHLPEENASLKAVLDLRINENADLRRQNTELQAKIAELEEIRVKNDQLLYQKENLEAIILLKTDNEKQLQERHQSLLRRFDRESKEKKRLSMGYEELLYKLEECQSSEDLTKRSLSDIPSMTSSAVVMRSNNTASATRPRHRGLQHDRSKRKTIASSRELD